MIDRTVLRHTRSSHGAAPTGSSRRAALRLGLLGLLAPAGLAGCGIRLEEDAAPSEGGEKGAEGASTADALLRDLQGAARRVMRSSLANGSGTRWVTEGLQAQVKELMTITGGVEIDEKEIEKSRTNRDVADQLRREAELLLPRLHEAGEHSELVTEMVAWWLGANHALHPLSPLPSVPDGAAVPAAATIGTLHEVTWAMEVLTTRLAAEMRYWSRRRIKHLEQLRTVVSALAGDAGDRQQIAYEMPREVMDLEERPKRFLHFLDRWSKELRQQLADHADDAQWVHLLTVQLGVARGLTLDWTENTAPAVPGGKPQQAQAPQDADAGEGQDMTGGGTDGKESDEDTDPGHDEE
ncbi:hypothetical protein SAMN05445756_1797 [Kytococcus aerolatus]|uniref:DUF4439 domain-containing protein n=1 Tax=Kytococcus aerolatus TaxID=592308 RepID=A0A212U247_9MICO|nr:hypothetical protein [Kytococcus aerolatus]SNC72303.1 hypothetical protein SAMN05445756_1797 [Kytococcus aerolatus]